MAGVQLFDMKVVFVLNFTAHDIKEKKKTQNCCK